MAKWKYVTRPVWRWLVIVPSSLLTGYNLYRQEINTSAPPFINLIKDIHWSWWLLITLLLITILIFEGLIRYNLDQNKKSSHSKALAEVQTSKQVGGQTIGNVFGNVVYQQPQIPTPAPRLPVRPMTTVTPADEIKIFHNSPELDEFGNPLEFKFTISNDTNTDFAKCAVYINEVAYKTQKSKQWEIINDLPSEKPLLWDDFILDHDGNTGIDAGHRKAFILARANIDKYEPRTYKYRLVFYKHSISLPHEEGINHRVLIHFRGKIFLGANINKKYYVYLRERKPGIREFENIESATI